MQWMIGILGGVIGGGLGLLGGALNDFRAGRREPVHRARQLSVQLIASASHTMQQLVIGFDRVSLAGNFVEYNRAFIELSWLFGGTEYWQFMLAMDKAHGMAVQAVDQELPEASKAVARFARELQRFEGMAEHFARLPLANAIASLQATKYLPRPAPLGVQPVARHPYLRVLAARTKRHLKRR